MIAKHRIITLIVAAAVSLTAAAQFRIVPCPKEIQQQSGTCKQPKNIVVNNDPTMKPESYRLEVKTDGISITAADSAGTFYAQQTLKQLGDKPTCMTITDEPRFGYRGLMMDVVRYFTPKEHLLRIVDAMAMLKLNTLHLHLTDDNGWRIEIKRYPKLTEVGSRRVEREGKSFPERKNQHQSESTVEKGFYTQQDIRDIVSYCAERHIEVIPEIEMPAHANALLASYPELTCPVVDKFVGVLPGLGGDNAKIICCAGNDYVYTFLQNVLDEVMPLFPSRYFHIGGDEADKTYWRACPLCQKRIRDEKLEDEEALQGYFMARMARYLQQKGKEVIGWDELTNTRVPDDVIIFGWRGYGNAALKAARQGHRFMLTPAKIAYLIRYQGPQWFEPLTYFGNNTLKDVYDFEPVKQDWTPEMKDLFMGVQASLWTEFCWNNEDVDYLLFPRLTALAEVAWSQPERKDWPSYLKALDRLTPQIESLGLKGARSMYNIQHEVKVGSEERGVRSENTLANKQSTSHSTLPTPHSSLEVSLNCIRSDVEIRYTTNGKEPTAKATLYKQPIALKQSTTVKAATFQNGKQMGATLTLPVNFNLATAQAIESDGADNLSALVNGVRGSKKQTDGEWCTWTKTDKPVVTIDLGKSQQIKRLTFGVLNNFGMGIHRPKLVSISISSDGQTFKPVAKQQFQPFEIFEEGTRIIDLSYPIGQSARYVRIDAETAGAMPISHVRPGQQARLFFDEVIIE